MAAGPRQRLRALASEKVIELDDGKILTGKPNQFDGQNHMVSGEDFPVNQSIDFGMFVL